MRHLAAVLLLSPLVPNRYVVPATGVPPTPPCSSTGLPRETKIMGTGMEAKRAVAR
jgi:hypothetical protein